MQLSRLYFETVLKYTREHETVSLCSAPAPLLMYAWRNERALKDNHLVKCIHYTGEKNETTCCWYFGDVLSRPVIIQFSTIATTLL